MPSWIKSLVAGAGLASVASAVTSVSDSDMTNLLNAGGVELAMKAQPMFFFGQAMNQPPCIPTFATQGDKQTPSAGLCKWPDAGCNCRTPGVPISNPSPSFPIYYSYEKCTEASIRIQYSLFYEKDGFTPENIFGHPYDWERVIVIWKKAEDGQWRPSELKLSQHSGYQTLEWDQIQNTLNADTADQQIGGPNGQQNLDHPKVYVEWAKHAHRNERNTGWNDVASQLTDHAFRSQDWWYFAKSEDYIRADRGTDVGKLIASFDWGHASSYPASVHDTLCSQ